MQYQLPQFIEVEDKVVGPFTFRQFIYLAGGAGLSYLLFALANQVIGLPFIISLFFPVPAVILALALTFYKVNNRPFIYTLEAALKYYFGSKLYLWKKEQKKISPQQPTASAATAFTVPTLSDSKLKDVRWNIDIQEKARLYAEKNNELTPNE